MHGENSPEHAPVAKKPEQPQPGQSSAKAQGLQTDEFGETTTAGRNARSRGGAPLKPRPKQGSNATLEMHGENSPEHAPVAKPSTDQAAPAPKKPSAPAVDPRHHAGR